MVLVACNHSGSEYRKYNRMLGEIIGDKPVKEVYVLTANHCYGCNVMFARWLEDKVRDSASLIIINAELSHLDLSAFLHQPGVYFRFHPEDTFFQSTKIIYWKDNHMEHITPINVRTVRLLNKPDWMRQSGYELEF